jgi:hypothetical protein
MKISGSFRSTSPAVIRLALAATVLTSAGCAGNVLDQRDLGNTSAPINPMPILASDGSTDPFVFGHWLGHAEDLFGATTADGQRPNYTFPSGSTDIRLNLSPEESTAASIRTDTSDHLQLIFGSGTVPEPQTGVAYPPGFDAYAGYPATAQQSLQLPPLEGFAYSLFSVVYGEDKTGIAAGSMGLRYALNQAYANWCVLQTPHQTTAGNYDCMTPFSSVDPQECSIYQAVDCNLGTLCQRDSVCHCFDTGCQMQPGEVNELWLVRDGNDLLGNFVGTVVDYGNKERYLPLGSVRFRRQDP